MEEHHRRIAKIALSAGERYSLALAGGYAIQAHGIGTRPSGDVDLFLDWRRRGEFGDAVAAVIAALGEAGLEVVVIARGETFARLLISPAAHGADPDKMEIAADWRSQEPVLLGIGPVLHPDDGALSQITDAAFAEYGTAPDDIAALRRRFADWRAQLPSC